MGVSRSVVCHGPCHHERHRHARRGPGAACSATRGGAADTCRMPPAAVRGTGPLGYQYSLDDGVGAEIAFLLQVRLHGV
jgi:hypothetical protein